MKLHNLCAILTTFILFYSLTIEPSKPKNQQNSDIIALSIPKAGTYLLHKLIELLTRKQANFQRLYQANIIKNSFDISNSLSLIKPTDEIFDNATELYPQEFAYGHLIYTQYYDRLLYEKNFKILFIIRDPRDQLVSRVFYIYDNPERYPGLQHLAFDELLLGLIGSEESLYYPDLVSSHLYYLAKPTQKSISDIAQFYSIYLPWMHIPNCYTVKFERLVGPKGGGILDNQLIEIKKIAQFLSVPLDKEKLKTIADNLFGDTLTFRVGKIGSWKKYFTKEHKKRFKKIAGNLLIRLGYENDISW